MSLYSIATTAGLLTFQQVPFETHDVTHESASDYAPKDVLQAMRPREWVGEGDEHYRFLCTLFPTRIGGLNELQLLQNARIAHNPVPLMRGDAIFLGYFFIEKVLEHDVLLDVSGIGRVKEVEIHFVRSPYSASASDLTNMQYALMAPETPAPAAIPATAVPPPDTPSPYGTLQ